MSKTITEPRINHPDTPPVLDSRQLLGDRAEILIRHQDQIYRLRCTRQGRLILTK